MKYKYGLKMGLMPTLSPAFGGGESLAGSFLLLEGDMQSGTDRLLLEGDMQSGTDKLVLEGTN